MLIDAHCHLNDERLLPEIREIVDGMGENGLLAVVSASDDYASSALNARLAEENERVYATAGIHPHVAKDAEESHFLGIEKLASCGKVVAIGEIGLDYHYDLSPRDVQREVFVRQMELADAVRLPVVFHIRDAYEDFHRLIKENGRYLRHGGLIHCYGGSAEFARQIASFDFYFGFDGPLTFKNSRRPAEALLAVPPDRIVVETDAPYLSPEPLRGRKNYPANVRHVAAKAAEILGQDTAEFFLRTVRNTLSLFPRIKLPEPL